MEMIFVWITANWINILVALGFMVMCYALMKKGAMQEVATICLFLVTRAEDKFGSGTGEIKYQWVVDNVYGKLPSVVKFFLTAQEIDDAIEKAVDDLQLFLEEQSK